MTDTLQSHLVSITEVRNISRPSPRHRLREAAARPGRGSGGEGAPPEHRIPAARSRPSRADKYAAKLKFIPDESFDEGTHIDRLLRSEKVSRGPPLIVTLAQARCILVMSEEQQIPLRGNDELGQLMATAAVPSCFPQRPSQISQGGLCRGRPNLADLANNFGPDGFDDSIDRYVVQSNNRTFVLFDGDELAGMSTISSTRTVRWWKSAVLITARSTGRGLQPAGQGHDAEARVRSAESAASSSASIGATRAARRR